MKSTGPDRQTLSPVEGIIRNIVSPVENIINRTINGVQGTFGSVLSIGEIKKENKRLTEQVTKLQADTIKLHEFELQNIRLKEMLNFKDSLNSNFNLEPATVIARNPSNWFETITINKGESDGVQKNMAVVTGKGLVGSVINTSANSAVVLLIVDNSSAVGGLVQINRTPGVLEGVGDGSGNLKMSYLAKNAPIRLNQTVISSGLGGIFPKGLPIGKLTKIAKESNGLEMYALVRPFADFNRLEEVFVVKGIVGSSSPSAGGQ